MDLEIIKKCLDRTIEDIDNMLAPVQSHEETGSEQVERFERGIEVIWARLKTISEAIDDGKPNVDFWQSLWDAIPTEDEKMGYIQEKNDEDAELMAYHYTLDPQTGYYTEREV